ncbi:hypothetical protein CVT26_001305 [Gymnopilus dilepis]|uniref:Uncharacterized protein n=1 Tax=Gymnopilus dilepis TaxID=231916 RepID=A0A409Y205_9AGAR|nr:hypothetical protein CVT26_001305 [Gymnopilus dilepis]
MRRKEEEDGWWREERDQLRTGPQAVDPVSAFAGQPIKADRQRQTRPGALTPPSQQTPINIASNATCVDWEKKLESANAKSPTPLRLHFPIGHMTAISRSSNFTFELLFIPSPLLLSPLLFSPRPLVAASGVHVNSCMPGTARFAILPYPRHRFLLSPPSTTTRHSHPLGHHFHGPRWRARRLADRRADRRQPHVVTWWLAASRGFPSTALDCALCGCKRTLTAVVGCRHHYLAHIFTTPRSLALSSHVNICDHGAVVVATLVSGSTLPCTAALRSLANHGMPLAFSSLLFSAVFLRLSLSCLSPHFHAVYC